MSDDFDASFLPEPWQGADVGNCLMELTERRMLSPARQANYELRLVGATVLPQQQVITKTQYGTWKFVNHLEDPTAKQYGGQVPIPLAIRTQLGEQRRCGVRPDHIWIGHQLPDNYREGDPLVPPPYKIRAKDEQLVRWLAKAARLYLKVIRTILTGAAAAPVVVAGTVAAVGGVGLDPIIFGGVEHPELPVVMWCVLAQWVWE